MELIVVSQTTCSPCKVLKNYLKNEEIPYKEVNLTDHPEEIEKYDVSSTPVTILMDSDGEEVARVNGFNPDEISDLASQL